MQFVVYKSSAGSGKTFTLAKEYLLLALSSKSPSRYKQILAITFTNKAAQEMKSRVIKYLGMLSGIEKKDEGIVKIEQTLIEHLKISENQLKERSKNTLYHILHNYSDFNITTIDKFIVRIVKAFNMEMKLPFNFEIEMDIDAIKEEALDRLIAKVGEKENQALSSYFYRYIKDTIQADSNWRFEQQLLKLYNKLQEESPVNYFDEIAQYNLSDLSKIRSDLKKDIDDYSQQCSAKINAINKAYEQLNLDPKTLHKGKNGIDRLLRSTILNEKFIFENEVSKTLAEAIDYQSDWDKHGNKGINEALEPIVQKLNDLVAFKQTQLPKVHLFQEIHKSFFSFTLLSIFHQEIQVLKQEKNILFLSEFNEKINEFVLDQPVPFIYEKIGEKFKNYLIDEFQDTSNNQWQNLLPLLENALAYHEKNIIVGDVKQAIYRWRGGDVDQFNELPYDAKNNENPLIQERYKSLKRNFNPNTKALVKNWRSLPNVIKFNNVFLSHYLTYCDANLEQYYRDYVQEHNEAKKGGYVALEILNYKEEEDIELKRVESIIKDALNRGYEWKNIAVLTRRNVENQKIAAYLTEQKIAINSDESLNLAQSEEVVFLMDIYQILFDENNKKAIVNACDFLLKKAAFLNYTQHQNILSKEQSFEGFIEYLKKYHNIELPSINSLSTYEIIEELIALFQLRTDNPFIQALLNLLIQKNRETPIDLISWWKEKQKKLFINTPDSYDAVNILTIHKSKGLEYDIVIVPYAQNIVQLNLHKNNIWVNLKDYHCGINAAVVNISRNLQDDVKQYELDNNLSCVPEVREEITKAELDNLNLLYVAITRAGKELYLFSEQKSAGDVFSAFIQHHENNENYNVTDNTLIFGEKTIKDSDAKKEQTNQYLQPKNTTNSSWQNKVKMSFTAPNIWNVPQNSSEKFDQLDPRKYGNLIHLIFAKLNQDFNHKNVIEECFNEGLIEENLLPEIKVIFENALHNNNLQTLWKTGDHWIERAIIVNKNKQYRPDRVIVNDDQIYIIDFKTGEEQSKDKKQIHNYQKLLQQIKTQKVSSYLYYTNNDQLIAC